MGKTSLATNIAFNAAMRYVQDKAVDGENEHNKGAVVGFFSLEMSADQLASRILAERSGISSENLRRGKLTNEQFQSVVRASKEIESAPFFIDDTPALTIAGLRTRARRLKRQQGLSLIIIDYLQLLSGSRKGSFGDNRVNEISEISRGLKSLAKELEIPVMALSQLSRQVEHRENKRPLLSDLRESGSIEQDADIVMFVYREEYYKSKEEPSEVGSEDYLKWQANMEALHGVAEVIIGKNRHGPVDSVKLHFEDRLTRFSDLVTDNYIPERRG